MKRIDFKGPKSNIRYWRISVTLSLRSGKAGLNCMKKLLRNRICMLYWRDFVTSYSGGSLNRLLPEFCPTEGDDFHIVVSLKDENSRVSNRQLQSNAFRVLNWDPGKVLLCLCVHLEHKRKIICKREQVSEADRHTDRGTDRQTDGQGDI